MFYPPNGRHVFFLRLYRSRCSECSILYLCLLNLGRGVFFYGVNRIDRYV